MRGVFGVFAIAGSSLIAISCSSGPQAPQPGSPAFYWAAAKSTYGTGDFVKASENLSQLIRSDNEYSARAQPILMVLSAGMARAYMDLADNFDEGARANRANPMPFRRQATLFRGYASAAALQGAEIMHKYLTTPKVDTVGFEFPYPNGSAAEPVQLQRVAKGMLFPDAEIEQLQRAMVQRGVLMAAARAVGARDDVAKALEIFKQGDVKIPRATFLLSMAKCLHDQAGLFGPRKLDQPQRVAMLCKEAEEAVKAVPEGKETKDLLGQIAKTRKASKVT
jgi:hypothetical protein